MRLGTYIMVVCSGYICYDIVALDESRDFADIVDHKGSRDRFTPFTTHNAREIRIQPEIRATAQRQNEYWGIGIRMYTGTTWITENP